MAAIHADAFTQSRAWTVDEFTSLLAHSSVFVIGDEDAFVMARVIVDEAELLTIATRTQVQRQGRARDLMERWHAEAAARGAVHTFLEVAADNTAARALYQACGYKEAGLRRAYYPRANAPDADAVIMAQALTLG